MARQDIGSTTTTTAPTDFAIGSLDTDGVQEQTESFNDNEDWTKFYGKYMSSTKLKSAIKKYATWVVGLGWTASSSDTVILENIRGPREDTILSFLWNMVIVKKINGDAYAEIIRDEDTGNLINLKPLNPGTIRVVFNREGIIIRYEQKSRTKDPNKIIPVEKMFHIINDRIADSLKGDSVIESLIWNLEAQEEARRMYRKKVKNSGIIGIVEADTQDTAKLATLKTPIKKGLEDGTFLMIPKDVLEVKDWVVRLNTQEMIQWLGYLDDEFYQILGIPKVIAGGSGEIEGDSKISYLTFEPDYKRAIRELEDDFWNQIGIRIKFNLPPSLKQELVNNEQANTSQVGFQPNDTTAGVGE